MCQVRFTFEAGFTIRGALVTALKNQAFHQDITLLVDEDKGWLGSNYRFTAIGDRANLDAYIRWTKELGRLNANA